MKKSSIRRVCPLCNESYTGSPAISRTDNETEICPDCGTRQALRTLNVSEKDIEHIIQTIHKTQETN